MIKYSNILFSVLLLFAVAEAGAQQLASADLTPDARTAGFAGAGVALDAHSFSLYNNMAATSMSEFPLQASYGISVLGNDNFLHTLGGYYRLNEKHTFAVGARYFMSDKIRNTSDGISFTSVKPYDLLLDIAYARRVNQNISLSVNVKYVNSKLNEGNGFEKASGVGLDLGIFYRKDIYSLAATVYNLGTLLDYGVGKYRMPASLKLGGAYRWSPATDHKVTGSLEGRYNFLPEDYTFFSGSVGAEYLFREMVAIRGGYHLASESKSTGNYGSIGCGVYLGPVVADFAWNLAEKKSPMHNVWRISAGVRF